MLHPTMSAKLDNAKREERLRRIYASLQRGDRVEVIHYIKIGFREHQSRTIGVVVSKERRECGMDGGFRRNWDDKYWFDHLLLRKADGELTAVTMDEFTEITMIDEATNIQKQ